MSYKGYDKWEFCCDEFFDRCSSFKELKQSLVDHLKRTCINQQVSDYVNQEYEITSVKLTIKKKIKVGRV